MPDLTTLAGGATQAAVVAATSTGIAISDAGTDTKGAWTELIAATTWDTAWAIVSMSGASADSFLVDVGVGVSTAEKVLIPDILHKSQTSAVGLVRTMLYPVSIPAGTRVSARCASSSTLADITNISLTLIAATLGSLPGMGRAEGFGSTPTGSTGTSIDPGGVAHTMSAWTQLIAATGFDYRWLALQVTTTVLTGVNSWLVDLGIGANPNEKVLIGGLTFQGGTNSDGPMPCATSFPIFVPAGTRLSWRVQNVGITAGERALVLAGQGMG